MALFARWTNMDSPVKPVLSGVEGPANDAGECGAGVASHRHPTSVTLRSSRRVTMVWVEGNWRVVIAKKRVFTPDFRQNRRFIPC